MKLFLKNKLIMSGVFMMIFYQVMMITIFMSGYSAMPKNMPELTVAIVNEDAQSGEQFVTQLKEQLPFHIKTDLSLDEARSALDDRDVHLVMHIPGDFTQVLSEQGKQAKLDFYINQSGPTTVSSSMQSVANQIASQLTANIQSQSFAGMLQGMQVPEEQAQQMVDGVMTKVATNMVMTNEQPAGMHNQMAPMFLAMASYVGAMIYSMMSVSALNQVKGIMGKWKAFAALQGTNIVLSLIAPLTGIGIYFMFHGYGGEAFVTVWLTHALQMFVSILFTSMFCMLAGQAGMLLNMPILLSQTIANGAMMPQAMMPGYFKAISYISPMYYTIHLDYNTLFGGGQSGKYWIGLVLVGAGALLVNAVIYAFKRVKETSAEEQAAQPAMSF
ncbi:DUF3533 domain-containing protein [Paenibacillus nanensis]|uniref:DUF3533 domain-containing protein n=1 Tax=Paenibacillus nanensis TaxID=393251 RepID=A0A3A1UZL1_9BACL|nr:ABC transporter permease [Paenibacillus nanensis]RIX53928.1 DUF3533 domain-containing protein [Paenibacillus nanensis]